MEKWDLYTRYKEKTGKEHIRGEKMPESFYHFVVHVWILYLEGVYLISQRSAKNSVFPLLWECVEGSVLIGESSIDGAIREVKEEVGIDLEKKAGKLLFTKLREDILPDKDIVDVWIFDYHGEVHLKNAMTDEVADCKWMTVSEIMKLHQGNKLVPDLNYFFHSIELC